MKHFWLTVLVLCATYWCMVWMGLANTVDVLDYCEQSEIIQYEENSPCF